MTFLQRLRELNMNVQKSEFFTRWCVVMDLTSPDRPDDSDSICCRHHNLKKTQAMQSVNNHASVAPIAKEAKHAVRTKCLTDDKREPLLHKSALMNENIIECPYCGWKWNFKTERHLCF